jgi:hypothetical protein
LMDGVYDKLDRVLFALEAVVKKNNEFKETVSDPNHLEYLECIEHGLLTSTKRITTWISNESTQS